MTLVVGSGGGKEDKVGVDESDEDGRTGSAV